MTDVPGIFGTTFKLVLKKEWFNNQQLFLKGRLPRKLKKKNKKLCKNN
jgi:hypothetical protein